MVNVGLLLGTVSVFILRLFYVFILLTFFLLVFWFLISCNHSCVVFTVNISRCDDILPDRRIQCEDDGVSERDCAWVGCCYIPLSMEDIPDCFHPRYSGQMTQCFS